MSTDFLLKGVQSSADWLNGVVLFSIGVALVVLLLRIIGQNKIQVFGVTMDLDLVWLVFLALSLAHAAATIVHLRSVAALMFYGPGLERNDPLRNQCWQELIASGPLVFRHVVQTRQTLGPLSLPALTHPLEDPTALPTYLSALALFAAHCRWRGQTWRARVQWAIIGLAVTIANWWIASFWIFGTIELPGSRAAATYLSHFR